MEAEFTASQLGESPFIEAVDFASLNGKVRPLLTEAQLDSYLDNFENFSKLPKKERTRLLSEAGLPPTQMNFSEGEQRKIRERWEASSTESKRTAINIENFSLEIKSLLLARHQLGKLTFKKIGNNTFRSLLGRLEIQRDGLGKIEIRHKATVSISQALADRDAVVSLGKLKLSDTHVHLSRNDGHDRRDLSEVVALGLVLRRRANATNFRGLLPHIFPGIEGKGALRWLGDNHAEIRFSIRLDGEKDLGEDYEKEFYRKWLKDPETLHSEWVLQVRKGLTKEAFSDMISSPRAAAAIYRQVGDKLSSEEKTAIVTKLEEGLASNNYIRRLQSVTGLTELMASYKHLDTTARRESIAKVLKGHAINTSTVAHFNTTQIAVIQAHTVLREYAAFQAYLIRWTSQLAFSEQPNGTRVSPEELLRRKEKFLNYLSKAQVTDIHVQRQLLGWLKNASSKGERHLILQVLARPEVVPIQNPFIFMDLIELLRIGPTKDFAVTVLQHQLGLDDKELQQVMKKYNRGDTLGNFVVFLETGLSSRNAVSRANFLAMVENCEIIHRLLTATQM